MSPDPDVVSIAEWERMAAAKAGDFHGKRAEPQPQVEVQTRRQRGAQKFDSDEAYTLYCEGWTMRDLGELYDVSQSAISQRFHHEGRRVRESRAEAGRRNGATCACGERLKLGWRFCPSCGQPV